MIIQRWLAALRRRRPPATEDPSEVSREAILELERLLREQRGEVRRADSGRPPTEEDVVRAAWANLAIEETDLEFEEAKRLLVARSRRRVLSETA